MWGAVGFLSRFFRPFEEGGISVDLIATSQYAVSVTLDHIPGGITGAPMVKLLEKLEQMGEVSVLHPCAVVSIVGRRLRMGLGELSDSFKVCTRIYEGRI
jgi:aspartokinase